jgi:ABC-type amino acid transport system permease subunit
MTAQGDASVPEETAGTPRLAILLAMAMFVLVVDTSLMNVSISAVVRDLDATVSGVQSAIALEALVSAAFILMAARSGISSAASGPTSWVCSNTPSAPWRWRSPRV